MKEHLDDMFTKNLSKISALFLNLTAAASLSTAAFAGPAEQTAFKQGFERGEAYLVAEGVKLSPAEIRDTAETKAYRNGYPNSGSARTRGRFFRAAF
jgi:hypothetical protein